jgi:hypothetical protein
MANLLDSQTKESRMARNGFSISEHRDLTSLIEMRNIEPKNTECNSAELGREWESKAEEHRSLVMDPKAYGRIEEEFLERGPGDSTLGGKGQTLIDLERVPLCRECRKTN